MPPRTDLGAMNCSLAKTLDVIGERWTLLVLREAFFGTRRFDVFRERLGVARNVLAARLDGLVADGIMRKVPYSERPPRFEYRLTEKGLALHPVLLAIKAWGDRFTDAADARPLLMRHTTCGEVFDAAPMCSHCGTEVHPHAVQVEAGPGASPGDIAYLESVTRARRERARTRQYAPASST